MKKANPGWRTEGIRHLFAVSGKLVRPEKLPRTAQSCALQAPVMELSDTPILIAGVAPANHAAKLDLIEALRTE